MPVKDAILRIEDVRHFVEHDVAARGTRRIALHGRPRENDDATHPGLPQGGLGFFDGRVVSRPRADGKKRVRIDENPDKLGEPRIRKTMDEQPRSRGDGDSDLVCDLDAITALEWNLIEQKPGDAQKPLLIVGAQSASKRDIPSEDVEPRAWNRIRWELKL